MTLRAIYFRAILLRDPVHHSLKDLHYMFNVEISKMQVFKNIVAVKLMGLNFTNENFVICSTFWTN